LINSSDINSVTNFGKDGVSMNSKGSIPISFVFFNEVLIANPFWMKRSLVLQQELAEQFLKDDCLL
jgi:hypothetical protein